MKIHSQIRNVNKETERDRGQRDSKIRIKNTQRSKSLWTCGGKYKILIEVGGVNSISPGENQFQQTDSKQREELLHSILILVKLMQMNLLKVSASSI